MYLASRFLLITLTVSLFGCSPTFNWREVRLEGVSLKSLLPCKPDRASRQIEISGQALEMKMAGCEAGDMLFAVSYVALPDKRATQRMLAQWKAGMLQSMQVQDEKSLVFNPKFLPDVTDALKLEAKGHRSDGTAVTAQALWFANDSHLYHAVIYAGVIPQDVAETFFSGLVF